MTDVRYLTAISLIALVPVALFILDRSAMVVALSLVSVLVIAGSLFHMFSGGGRAHDAHGDDHARPPTGEA